MKVILNEEVVGLGEPGKIVDVAPGYARNFLVPRKLAVYANTGSVKELEHHKRRLERKRQRLQTAAMGVAERIQSLVLNITARSGEGNKLYGSVTSSDLAEALQTQFDVTVDRRKIHLREPIRTLGEHTADVQLMGETRATLQINVTDPAKQAEAAAPAAAPAPAPAAEAAPAETTEETAE